MKSKNPSLILVKRQKAPLKLTLVKDSLSWELSIRSFNSLNYYLNIPTNYGIGMLLDKKNPERYSFPKRLYIDLKENAQDSLRYQLFKRNYRNSIKINALKLIGAINAGLEISYERFTGNRYSTQLNVGYVYSECWICDGGSDGKGLQFGLEEKLLLKGHEQTRAYFSLEGGGIFLDTEMSIYFVPKFGMQVYPAEHFFLDGSIGIGIQMRDVGTEKSFPDAKVPFNLRFGWRF